MISEDPDQKIDMADLLTALSLMSGEVIHEVVHTLHFLRYFVEQTRDDATQDQETSTLAVKEIARLERLQGILRRFKRAAPQHESIRLDQLIQHLVVSLASTSKNGGPTHEIEIPADLTVQADAKFMNQILHNLLEHARYEAGPSGSLGIRLIPGTATSAEGMILVVWDSGPPIAEAARASLFLPLMSIDDGKHRLRLAIANRLVRDLGWTLAYERIADRNEYRITIPEMAIEGTR